MTDLLFADFTIGNMCGDLVEMTIEYCTKDKVTRSYRFPVILNGSLVSRLVNKANQIDEFVSLANALPKGHEERKMYKYKAKALCIHMSRLIHICFKRGWISEKQHDRWNGLVVAIYWKIHALIHSWDCWINRELEPLGYQLIFNKNKVRIKKWQTDC